MSFSYRELIEELTGYTASTLKAYTLSFLRPARQCTLSGPSFAGLHQRYQLQVCPEVHALVSFPRLNSIERIERCLLEVEAYGEMLYSISSQRGMATLCKGYACFMHALEGCDFTPYRGLIPMQQAPLLEVRMGQVLSGRATNPRAVTESRLPMNSNVTSAHILKVSLTCPQLKWLKAILGSFPFRKPPHCFPGISDRYIGHINKARLVIDRLNYGSGIIG